MEDLGSKQKVVVVGAGPVGSLAALYAAARGDDVEIYELRGGEQMHLARLAPFDTYTRSSVLYANSPQFLNVPVSP